VCKSLGGDSPALELFKVYDTTGIDIPGGMAVASDGAIYFSGIMGGTNSLGETSISPGSYFVAKINSTGAVLWASSPVRNTPTGEFLASSLTVDHEGNAYLLLDFLGQYRFGNFVVGDAVDAERGFTRFGVIKYSPSGEVLWTKVLSRSFNQIGERGLRFGAPQGVIDREGNLLVAWRFNAQANIEDEQFGTNGEYDSLVARLSPAGNVIWIKKAGGPNGDSARAIATDADGAVYFAGFHANSAFFNGLVVDGFGPYVAKYTPQGETVWVFTKELSINDGNFLDLAVTPSGDLAVVGYLPTNTNLPMGLGLVLASDKRVKYERQFGMAKVPHNIIAQGGDFVVASALLDTSFPWDLSRADVAIERFDASFSSARWEFPIRSVGEDSVNAFDQNARGQLHTLGGYSGSALFKDQVITGKGERGLFLMVMASEAAALPVITSEPTSKSIFAGSMAELAIGVQSSAQVTHQWFFNSAPIAGGTNATLLIPNVTAANEGFYFVEVSNAAGTVRSAAAQLVIRGQVPLMVTTVAGTNSPGYVDSTNRAAVRFFRPDGLEYLTGGIVAVADGHNHVIRLVDGAGSTTTLAGRNRPGYVDGPAAQAEFRFALGLNVEKSLDVVVADSENNVIRRLNMFGLRNVSTVAGTGLPGYRDGPAGQAQFHFPNDLVTDANGNIFVTEFTNHTVRRISADGMVTTFAGNGTAGFRDGVGTNASFNMPAGIEIDAQQNLYVTEWRNHTVRKISPEGVVSTLAGANSPGLLDGQGNAARFNSPDGITIDPLGNLYVTDYANHAVRKIDANGNVVTLAGLGVPGFKDGDKATALFNSPAAITWHPDGSLWVSDFENHAIRRIEFLNGPSGDAAEILVTLNPALTIFGKAGATYRIEAAEASNAGEAMDWKAVDSVTLSGESEMWFDTQPATRKKRFYRAVKVE
jgi:serine/threonine protein kinase, bacterial